MIKYKNKFSFFNELFVVFEKSLFNFYYNKKFYKNDYYLNVSDNIIYYLNSNINNLNTIIDLVAYENNNKLLKNDELLFYKIYNYNKDIYYSLFLKKHYSNYKFYKNLIWLEREVIESFNYSFYNNNDQRNLLLNYDFRTKILKKKNSLESLKSVKSYYNNYLYNNINKTVEL